MKKYIRIYYLITILYDAGITIWNGTIYLFMHHIGYSYGQINFYLAIFWVVTFFAEIPSGYFADHFGYLKTILISGFVRAAGLFILALSPMNIPLMAISGILTALGDSLQSGTMGSWIANRASINQQKDQLGDIYSKGSIIATPLSMLVGFIGPNILGNIALNLPLIVGSIILIATSLIIIPMLKYDSRNLNKKEPKITKLNLVSDVKTIVKYETSTFKLILLFMPILLISAGPLDQWQLYFQRDKQIKTGTILVVMNLVGLIGTYVYNRLVNRKINQVRMILVSVILMALTILATVITNRIYYLSLSIFMINTLAGSFTDMAQGTLLQSSIQSETNRATIISVSNAVDAAVSVIVLAVNGYISDHFGIGPAWISLAVVGLILFIGGYIFNRKTR